MKHFKLNQIWILRSVQYKAINPDLLIKLSKQMSAMAVTLFAFQSL